MTNNLHKFLGQQTAAKKSVQARNTAASYITSFSFHSKPVFFLTLKRLLLDSFFSAAAAAFVLFSNVNIKLSLIFKINNIHSNLIMSSHSKHTNNVEEEDGRGDRAVVYRKNLNKLCKFRNRNLF
jgi:hypothetical protein